MAEQVTKNLGYVFKDTQLLERSVTHASCAGHRLESNERMEFLGDAILGYVVCERLFHLFPDLLEGELTKIKSSVVSRKTCAEVSNHLQLHKLLNLGKGMCQRTALPSSIAAAVLEALIAAIYLDGGLEPARQFILDNFEDIITQAAASTHQQNFKSVLQQHAQRHLPHNPTYVMLDEKGPDHAKCFEVAVEMDGRRFTSAWANSKKEAEQKAALNALMELKVARQDEDGQILIDG